MELPVVAGYTVRMLLKILLVSTDGVDGLVPTENRVRRADREVKRGDVAIRVAESDTDFLTLVKVKNSGDPGGKLGSHGIGGAGGPPGRGGKPYSWTTSDTGPVEK